MLINKKTQRLAISLVLATIIILFNFFYGNEPLDSSPVEPVNLSSQMPSTSTVQVLGTSTADIDQAETGLESDEQSLFLVTRVVDGDTIEVDIDGNLEKLRLIGVDTPETVDPRKKVECFGLEASDFTKTTLLGQWVRLESDDSQDERDRYGRRLVYVWLGEELFNHKLIAEGYAHEYTYKTAYFYQADFKLAQERAQELELGLWSPTSCAGQK